MTRRQLVLVLVSALGVAVLLRLGFWQKERLEWKTEYLAEGERSVEARPFRSLADIERAIAAGEPVNYRRVALDAEPAPDTPVWRVYRGNRGTDFLWERFVVAESGSRGRVLVGYDEVAGERADVPDFGGRVFGHVRHYSDVEDLADNRYRVEANEYYSFNPDLLWSEGRGVRPDLWIDALPGIASADSLPVRRPDIRNNHFQYMLTWWSFAAMLVVYAVILYRREDRAGPEA